MKLKLYFFIIILLYLKTYEISLLRKSRKIKNNLQLADKNNKTFKKDGIIYKKDILNNGLKVLLIQNKKTTKSGIFIRIKTGVNKEPKEVDGLTHLTEHSLFSGSKKYPDNKKLLNLIFQNNGKRNGVTTRKQTVYYFTINNNKLNELIDILYENFNEPLFDPKIIKREIKIIDQEFSLKAQNDIVRYNRLLSYFVDSENYMHKMHTGNNNTLNISNINSKLRKYFYDIYCPNNMELIIYGKDSLNDLLKMAINSFGKLNRQSNINYKDYDKLFSYKENMGKIIFYEKINYDSKLNFIIPYNTSFKDYKYEFYIKYFIQLFNYSGKNGIMDILKNEEYIFSIKMTYDYEMGYISIDAELTEKGVKELDKVISIIILYIKKLKKNSLNERLFNYLKESEIFKNNYNIYQEIHHVSYFISYIYENIKTGIFEDFDNFINGNKFDIKFDKNIFKGFLDSLLLQKSNIFIGTYNLKNYSCFSNIAKGFTPNYMNIEKFYKILYSYYDMNFEYLNTQSYFYDKSIPLPNFNFTKQMPINIYSYNMCKNRNKKCIKELKKDINKNMELILNINKENLRFKSYYKLERRYYYNKTIYTIQINYKNTNNYYSYIDFASNMRLIIFNMFHGLRNILYEESLRKNSIDAQSIKNGFLLNFYAFSSNIQEFILNVLNSIKNNIPSLQEFILLKEDYIRKLKSQTHTTLKEKMEFISSNLLLENDIKYSEIIQYFQQYSNKDLYDNYISFLKYDLFYNINITSLLIGGVEKENAIKLSKEIYNYFNTYHLNNNLQNKNRIKRNKNFYNNLDIKKFSYLFNLTQENIYNNNYGINIFYYIGKDTILNNMKINLLHKIFGKNIFHFLREKNQAGYNTKSQVVTYNDNIYYKIRIEGSKLSPNWAEEKIYELFSTLKENVTNISNSKFNGFKKYIISLIKNSYKVKINTLNKEKIILFSKIINNDYNKNDTYINITEETNDYSELMKINKNDIIYFFDQCFLDKQKIRKLIIKIFPPVVGDKSNHMNLYKINKNQILEEIPALLYFK